MKSFIHNGRETTTWTGHNLQNQKYKSQSQGTFLRKEHLFESQAADY